MGIHTFSLEELDRELIARGKEMPWEHMFTFAETEPNPERETMMIRVKEFYQNAPTLPRDISLKELDIQELVGIIKFKLAFLADNNRGIAGPDNRKDIYQVDDEHIRTNARSVAVICWEDDLEDAGTEHCVPRVKQCGKTYNLCPWELFSQQPILNKIAGTAFLVEEDVIATAGHCVNEADLSSLRFVFGYQLKDSNSQLAQVPKKNIYRGTKIIHKDYNRLINGSDWALVKLDRKVEGRQAVSLFAGEIRRGLSLYIIGHPLGLPLKFADGAQVQMVDRNYFAANLDVYSGNSGSPIFDKKTHALTGIVTQGFCKDLRFTGQCWTSVVYPDYCDIETNTPRVTRTKGLNAYLATSWGGKKILGTRVKEE